MLKKFAALLLVGILSISLAACGEQPNSDKKEEMKKKVSSNELEEKNTVKKDESLLDVTLEIPSNFVEGNSDGSKTQEDYDNFAKEKGYKSITLNEDGSLTYVMTKKRHKELMEELKSGFQESIDNVITSGNYPNFQSIETNDNYTEFQVRTLSQEIDFAEALTPMLFYSISGMYNAFNGQDVDNCKVIFINVDSGETIAEYNSKDVGNSEE